MWKMNYSSKQNMAIGRRVMGHQKKGGALEVALSSLPTLSVLIFSLHSEIGFKTPFKSVSCTFYFENL